MKIKVLDDGFVRFVDRMGDDYSIIRAARVSTGTEEKTNEKKDRKLIRYLYKNEHLTPFEQVVFSFHIRSPLFVNQQILRHRTFSFNQESARYKELEWKCYLPDKWRTQDTENKQGSLDAENVLADTCDVVIVQDKAKMVYNNLLKDNIAREQARIVMPMAQYTEMYFTVDLRNLLHFIDLRSDKHAQQEIQDYANTILEILNKIPEIKWTIEIFNDILKLKRAVSKNVQEIGIDETIRKLNS